MKTILELRYNDDNDTVELHYPPCPPLDSYIQNQIKPKNRVWSKPLKCWVILPEVLEVVVCIGVPHFQEIKYESLPVPLQSIVKRVLTYEQVSSVDPPHEKDDYAKLFLLPDAPSFLVKAAYKALAHHYHPDNKETGDVNLFQDVASAYTAIKN